MSRPPYGAVDLIAAPGWTLFGAALGGVGGALAGGLLGALTGAGFRKGAGYGAAFVGGVAIARSAFTTDAAKMQRRVQAYQQRVAQQQAPIRALIQQGYSPQEAREILALDVSGSSVALPGFTPQAHAYKVQTGTIA